MKNGIFLNFSNNVYAGELPQNYFSLHEKLPNSSKFKPKILDKIYIACDN